MQIRRDAYRNALRAEQQASMFWPIRRRLLKSFVEKNEEKYSTQQDNDLQILMNRSMVEDELMDDIKSKHLLEKLMIKAQSDNSLSGKKIILGLCSNVLLDNIDIESCESLMRICKFILENKQFQQDCAEFIEENILSIIGIISHVIACMTSSLKFLDEDLQVSLEQLILGHTLLAMRRLFEWEIGQIGQDFIKLTNYEQNQEAKTAAQIAKNISSTLSYFFNEEPEYLHEILGKTQRNLSLIRQMTAEHANFLKNSKNASFQTGCLDILHRGILRMFRTMINSVDITQIPLLFEERAILEIPLLLIFMTPNPCFEVEKACYEMVNVFLDERDCLSDLGNILTEIENQKLLLNNLEKNSNSTLKLKFIKHLAEKCENQGGLLEFFSEFWKYLIDFCCCFLRAGTSHQDSKTALQTLILFLQGKRKDSTDYINYFLSIGGESAIQEACLCAEEAEQYQGNDSSDISELATFLNFLIRLQEK